MSAAPKLEAPSEHILALEALLSGQLIQCAPRSPFYDLDLSVLVALDSIPKFSAVDPLHLLGPREKVHRFQVRSLAEKKKILSQVAEILDQYEMARSLKEGCLQCADELLTNSIFNAPFKEKIDRGRIDLEIPGDQPILFDVSVGETDIVISCTDPFGSLEIQPFFTRILNCYKSGVGESISFGIGGAGIGSHMIFEQCSSLILGIVPHKRTAFYCRFPIKMSSKNRKLLPKNIIVFNRED